MQNSGKIETASRKVVVYLIQGHEDLVMLRSNHNSINFPVWPSLLILGAMLSSAIIAELPDTETQLMALKLCFGLIAAGIVVNLLKENSETLRL